MKLVEAIMLGVIQGLAEFLPVSSSGHLVLFQHLFGLTNVEEGQYIFFDVLLHLGTLVAVFVAFRKTVGKLIAYFFRLIKKIFTGRFSYKALNTYEKMVILIVVATLPLALVLVLKDSVERLFTPLYAGIGLLLTAVLLFSADRVVTGKRAKIGRERKNMTLWDAVVIGIFQLAAIVPGISRSGSTISAGLFRGLSRSQALEFAFVLSIPAVLGANVVQFKDAVEVGVAKELYLPFALGTAAAAVTGYLAIQLLRYFMKKNKFGAFAYYCAAVGVVSVIVGIVGM